MVVKTSLTDAKGIEYRLKERFSRDHDAKRKGRIASQM